jgi:hypothetical protein
MLDGDEHKEIQRIAKHFVKERLMATIPVARSLEPGWAVLIFHCYVHLHRQKSHYGDRRRCKLRWNLEVEYKS